MELSAEGTTPEYMALAGIKFKLSLAQFKNDPQLKDELLKGVRAGNMAPYYKDICTEFGWPLDQALYDEMVKENLDRLSKFKEDDSETPVWQDR